MSDWIRVNKRDRCKICNSDSWCTYTDGVVLCMRVASQRTKTLSSGEQGWIHQLDASRPAPVMARKPEPKVEIDAAQMMDDFWNQDPSYSQQRVDNLAMILGVSSGSLNLMGCTWAMRHRAYAFPMCNGSGKIVGIRLRNLQGEKWAVKGSHQGIFLPHSKPDGTVLVVEGPTDCAAALTIGFYAIGRPSCSGGMDDTRLAVQRLGVKQLVIVADNDDPGLRGAKMFCSHMRVPTAILVPPCKDLREFLRLGGTCYDLQSILKGLVWSNKGKDE